MSLPKIKIVINGAGHGNVSINVSINGMDMPGVKAVNVRARAGRPSTVFFQLVGDLEIEAEPSFINAELLGLPVTILSGPPK